MTKPFLRAILLCCVARAKQRHGESVAEWVRNAGGGAQNSSLELARAGVSQALAELVRYYDGDERVLASAAGLGGDDAALVARVALAMAGRRGGGVFSVGVTGSSVTAGHGGFGDAAWPLVLERRLAPVWRRHFGVRFVVHNQAVGGRDPWPASWCLGPMMGAAVDVVMREWEYWGAADGLVVDDIGARQPKADFDLAGYELLLRVALTLPRQPAVHLVFLGHGGGGAEAGRVPKLAKELRKGGRLAAYADLPIEAFDAFGAPFDALRKAAPEKRVEKGGKKPCSGGNVAECPVAPKRQDGHHAAAAHPGYDAAAHPAWAAYDNHNLFLNWHPGALGHEVIGNQLAHYHLKLMLRALDMLTGAHKRDQTGGGGGLAHLERLAAPRPLPPPAQCAPAMCGFRGYRPACAIATLPKVDGPDVGDWVRNDSAAAERAWANLPVAPDPQCREADVSAAAAAARLLPALSLFLPPRGDVQLTTSPLALPSARSSQLERVCGGGAAGSQACYSQTLKCSSRDRKRAFKGSGASAPLRLRVPLADARGAACRVLVSEAYYEWSKPFAIANWHRELEVELDGKRCAPPACRVMQTGGGYRQDLLVDVAAARGVAAGAACAAKGPAELVLRVKPVAVSDAICAAHPRHGRCEPAGEWRRYNAQCVKRDDGTCELKTARSTRPEDINAFVAQVVTW